MNGKIFARIGGVDFPIEYGFTITECLGDELDSASIKIPHIRIKKDGEYTPQGKVLESLKPYDEVILHDCNPSEGNFWDAIKRKYSCVTEDNGRFYRHFLAMSPSATAVSLNDDYRNYSISLVSETKGLEKVIMPSRTITQPIGTPGRTVEFFATEFIERYSPLFKITSDGKTWRYAPKYIPSDYEWETEKDPDGNLIHAESIEKIHQMGLLTIHEAFGDYRAPETTLSGLGTLRSALTSLFTTRNMIPVVKDGIVFCMDLVRKGKEFSSVTGASFFSETMSGDDYCDRLQIGYSGGLTSKSEIHCHEYVGFRNKAVSNMRFSELKLEVSYPIYRINKLLMCYFDSETKKMEKMDITDFVLLDSGRAYLDNDWQDFNNHKPTTVKGFTTKSGEYVVGLADYRFMTVGYSIGSTEITGWGEYLQWTDNGVTQSRRTVLQNIFNAAVSYCLGSVSDASVGSDTFGSHGGDFVLAEDSTYRINAPSVYDNSSDAKWWASVIKTLQNFNLWVVGEDSSKRPDVLKLKTLFFEIDYQGMVSSNVEVSKTNHDGDVSSIDSQQSPMSFFEASGDIEKAKVNRLGNKALVQSARVSDPSNLLAISDCDSEGRIVYKRTCAIERDFISVTYYLCQDYVLKNYFSSVASRMRPFAYASYGESVKRLENHSLQFMISDSVQYKDEKSYSHGKSSFSTNLVSWDMAGFANGGRVSADLAYFSAETPDKSLAIYSNANFSTHFYSLDFAVYSHGDSLCITCQMPDSESAGTYIKKLYPTMGETVSDALDLSNEEDTLKYLSVGESPTNDITGTIQDWYMLPKSRADGAIEGMAFAIAEKAEEEGGRIPFSERYGDGIQVDNASDYIKRICNLPSFTPRAETYELFTAEEAFKDSKEVISETFQIEPLFDGCRGSEAFLRAAKKKKGGGGNISVILSISKFGVYGSYSPQSWYSSQADGARKAFARKYGVFRPQGLSISLFGPLGDNGESDLLKRASLESGDSPLITANVDGGPYSYTAGASLSGTYTLMTGFYSMEVSIEKVVDVQDGYIDVELKLHAKPRQYEVDKSGCFNYEAKSDAKDIDGENFAVPNQIDPFGHYNFHSPFYGEYLYEGRARMYDADYLSKQFFDEANDKFQPVDFEHLYLDDTVSDGNDELLTQAGTKAWITNPFPNRRQYVLNLIAMPKGTKQKIKGANGGDWVYVPEWSYKDWGNIPNDGKAIYGANTGDSDGGIGPVAKLTDKDDADNATTTIVANGNVNESYQYEKIEVGSRNALSMPELPILGLSCGNGNLTVGSASCEAPAFLSILRIGGSERRISTIKSWKKEYGSETAAIGEDAMWVHFGESVESAPKDASLQTLESIGEQLNEASVISEDSKLPALRLEAGKDSISIETTASSGSVACYQRGDDSLYHFVFGFDLKEPMEHEDAVQVGLKTIPATCKKTFYLSLVRDRSKKVVYENMEPAGERENYAGKSDGGSDGMEAS